MQNSSSFVYILIYVLNLKSGICRFIRILFRIRCILDFPKHTAPKNFCLVRGYKFEPLPFRFRFNSEVRNLAVREERFGQGSAHLESL
jgi:hypothetical protein